MVGLWTRQRGEAARFPVTRGPFCAGRGLCVAGLRLLGRSASWGQCEYFHLDGAFPQCDIDQLADAQRMGGLHALAVDLYLAAADGVSSERPGLEQAHVPQPFVEAVTLVGG